MHKLEKHSPAAAAYGCSFIFFYRTIIGERVLWGGEFAPALKMARTEPGRSHILASYHRENNVTFDDARWTYCRQACLYNCISRIAMRLTVQSNPDLTNMRFNELLDLAKYFLRTANFALKRCFKNLQFNKQKCPKIRKTPI